MEKSFEVVAAIEIFRNIGWMIEFHGDNKLLNEFVMMCHRSNNAIFKHLVLSWPYGYRMVSAIIWKDASNVFVYIFASTHSDQVVLRAFGALKSNSL